MGSPQLDLASVEFTSTPGLRRLLRLTPDHDDPVPAELLRGGRRVGPRAPQLAADERGLVEVGRDADRSKDAEHDVVLVTATMDAPS